MIEISFVFGMLVTVCGWVILRGCVNVRAGAFCWKEELKHLLLLINLLVIVRITFYPFAKVDGQVQPLLFDPAAVWPLRVNLIPFVNLLYYDSRRDLLLNLIGNVTAFIPTGIVVPLVCKRFDSWRKIFCTGAAFSWGIEILQLPFAVRASDVDDLILNTVGVLTGYGILTLCRFVKKGIGR